jgi:hypothetical protein
MVCAAFVLAWNWYGWSGVLGVIGVGFALLWLLARFGPDVSRGFFHEAYRQVAGPMREARITVHGITPADDADAVPAMLRQFDAWIDEFNEDDDSPELHIEVDEFLTHNEERPDLARYFIDITVSPPESQPDIAWSPHAISLRPAESQDASACELHDVEGYDAETAEFRPFLETAFQEITGEKRIRLHVGLDPNIGKYRFEYAFVNPLEATLEVPPRASREDPLRRFADGVFDRIAGRPVTTLSLSWLPITDDDLKRVVEFMELDFLGLEQTLVTDDGVGQLRVLMQLEALVLDGTQVGDAGISRLSELTNLKRLFVRNTNVTKDGVKRLRQAMPSLKVYA